MKKVHVNINFGMFTEQCVKKTAGAVKTIRRSDFIERGIQEINFDGHLFQSSGLKILS